MFVYTHQMVLCLHVCVEYLFDLCHGLQLITSADRWLYIYLFTLGQLFVPSSFLGVFFCML